MVSCSICWDEGSSIHIKIFDILFVDLVSDDILQMALGSDLRRKFGERILRTLLTNAIGCTLGHLAAIPLSTKII